jgi:hypothetical protein
MKTRMRPKPTTRAKKSTRWAAITKSIGGRTILLAALGVGATAMLIAARQEPQPAGHANIAPRPEGPAAANKPASSRAFAAESAPPSADVSEPIYPAVVTAATIAPPKSAPVTISGCLERSDGTFRLKDTAGADAPKSRSWKSGFLKKSSPSIEVVDAVHRLKLPDHVGQRVSVTGSLVDREMQVRSLQRIAASCG